MVSNIKLYYYQLYCRADGIRALLHLAKVPYEEVNYPIGDPKHAELKPTYEFG